MENNHVFIIIENNLFVKKRKEEILKKEEGRVEGKFMFCPNCLRWFITKEKNRTKYLNEDDLDDSMMIDVLENDIKHGSCYETCPECAKGAGATIEEQVRMKQRKEYI